MTRCNVLKSNVKKIEIEDSNCRKLIIDGKEVDLSKLQRIEISFDCRGIEINATMIDVELPCKKK